MPLRCSDAKRHPSWSVRRSMNYRALIALAAISLTGSSASEAKLRIFGHAPHASHTATVRARGPQPVPYHWTQGAAPKAHSDMVAEFGKVGLKPGEYVWATTVPTQGETRIVDRSADADGLRLSRRQAGRCADDVERNDRPHHSATASGPILEKRPFYRSKKYDNAPMPFMQRIDNYGIALSRRREPRLSRRATAACACR